MSNILKFECEFCDNTFKTKSSLTNHQKNAKYCLELRNVVNESYKCDYCDNLSSSKFNRDVHMGSCNKKQNKLLEKQIKNLENKNKSLEKLLEEKENKIDELQDRIYKLCEKSISTNKKPNTTNNNDNRVLIYNHIQNLTPLTEQNFIENIPQLTLSHHKRGAEGYAEYAYEFPFNGKIVCVDIARNKIKYKNDHGEILVDHGMKHLMKKFCKYVKDRSFDLTQEHFEDITKKFSEQELKDANIDINETTIEINKGAVGKESEFCNKMIKLIIDKSIKKQKELSDTIDNLESDTEYVLSESEMI